MCMQSPWQKAFHFHGHVCPELVIGYRAAEKALQELGFTMDSLYEDLFCWAEDKSSALDAIQATTGCTLGKDNLIVSQTGKLAFTFADRGSGKAVRVAYRESIANRDSLAALTDEEREDICHYLLELPAEQLFATQNVEMDWPLLSTMDTAVSCTAPAAN